VLLASGLPAAHATTINWGSPVLSTLVDSTGQQLDAGYHIQLGFFADSFVPTAANVADWGSNWRTFDEASYDPEMGYFTGTADLKADGSSSSLNSTLGINFSGQPVFMWIYNQTGAVEGSEWFLGRADSWVMPVASQDCCDSNLPAQWSTSDLSVSQTPVFGAQGPVIGGGNASNPGNYTIQTYQVVPEPSAVVLSVVGMALLLRRRKPQH